jgi:predicted Zn finger-like uncharacterized protein
MPLTVTCSSCKTSLRIKDEYAGKKVKCPKCSQVIDTRAQEEEEIEEAVVAESPADEGETQRCPECGKEVSARASICKFCQAELVEPAREADEEEEEEPAPRKKGKWKPCPKCGARGAKRVDWTFWGSFYGPRLLSHVRCPECGYQYNGKTGGSNLVWAIGCTAIPAILIAGLLGAIAYMIIAWFNEKAEAEKPRSALPAIEKRV